MAKFQGWGFGISIQFFFVIFGSHQNKFFSFLRAHILLSYQKLFRVDSINREQDKFSHFREGRGVNTHILPGKKHRYLSL